MIRRFGDRASFAGEVGGLPGYLQDAGVTHVSDFRVVDVWASGNRLTAHDNAAYVPTLLHHMRYTAKLVRQRDVPRCPFPWRSPAEVFQLLHSNDSEFRQKFWLLHDWDEILDGVEIYTWLDDTLVVTCRIRRPVRSPIFVARVPPDELVSTIDEAIAALKGD